ncbi:hypothetical protein PFISCL1PPCAC_16969 [Pristionchus fissidentatus]|uniref:Uncharacterized protein n=1 Tax=Pristionchus fissidentatus TaxID=1538716 RepID=A0AAV5W1G6_9BILA|nr:hypothetical protein PFISCL1PPCAC_16969 [Pristionchus fissidentatus]
MAGLAGGALILGVCIGMTSGNKKKKSKTKKSKDKKKKKEEVVDADVTVLVPGHQMSQFTSGNLTAAILDNKQASIPSSTA